MSCSALAHDIESLDAILKRRGEADLLRMASSRRPGASRASLSSSRTTRSSRRTTVTCRAGTRPSFLLAARTNSAARRLSTSAPHSLRYDSPPRGRLAQLVERRSDRRRSWFDPRSPLARSFSRDADQGMCASAEAILLCAARGPATAKSNRRPLTYDGRSTSSCTLPHERADRASSSRIRDRKRFRVPLSDVGSAFKPHVLPARPEQHGFEAPFAGEMVSTSQLRLVASTDRLAETAYGNRSPPL